MTPAHDPETAADASERSGSTAGPGPGSASKPVRVPVRAGDRSAAFARLIQMLGSTPVGAEAGLDRLGSFDDLRASLPVRDAVEHREAVERRLGFGDDDELEGTAAARAAVVARWQASSGLERPPRRFARLAPQERRGLAQARLADLMAWGGPDARCQHFEPQAAEQMLERLAAAAPEALVVPSLHTIAWLERASRSAIERRLPSMRVLMSEYDMHLRVRSALPLLSVGRWHAAGRLALPPDPSRSGVRGRHVAARLELAWDSTLLELRDAGTQSQSQDRRNLKANASDVCVPLHRGVMGARYELVVSASSGFLRARTGVFVRLVGYARVDDAAGPARVPRVQPIVAPPPDLRLEGVTLRGAWLTSALRHAFEPEDPALIAGEIRGRTPAGARGPSATLGASAAELFDETELGRTAAVMRTRARPRQIELRVELRGVGREGFEQRLATRFDQRLCASNPAYAFLRERGDLQLPVVERARDGRERADLWLRAGALQGAVARPQIQVFSS